MKCEISEMSEKFFFLQHQNRKKWMEDGRPNLCYTIGEIYSKIITFVEVKKNL